MSLPQVWQRELNSSAGIIENISYVILNLFDQICAFFVNLLFLGQAFTIMLVYVWARRNPFIRMNFFGLLNFQVSTLI